MFRGNQKNIRIGLPGRNNANSGLLTCTEKDLSDFRTTKETKRNFSSHTDVFPIGPLFSKSTLNLMRFDTKFVVV